MDCPKCGTWNPDDKRVCWRCQTELPKPIEKKRRRPAVFLGLPAWIWAFVAIMTALWFTAQCLGPTLLGRR
jgi:hypothetical protein